MSSPGSDHRYTPTVADVGHRLRASVYYADQFGNRVKAMTKPSEPVQPDILRVLAPLGSEDGGGAAGALSQATSGEPAARGVFDIYLGEGSLVFVKDPCARADTEAMFFLHLYPVDVNDLPDHRKQYGFDNLDFRFGEYRLPLTERPVAVRELPDYAIARIRTGQYIVEGKKIWEGSIEVVEPVDDGKAAP